MPSCREGKLGQQPLVGHRLLQPDIWRSLKEGVCYVRILVPGYLGNWIVLGMATRP
jgi:hypothetical protein